MKTKDKMLLILTFIIGLAIGFNLGVIYVINHITDFVKEFLQTSKIAPELIDEMIRYGMMRAGIL